MASQARRPKTRSVTAALRPSRMPAYEVALAFLPAEAVSGAKLVSKEMRSAARLVLTKGRYRPVAQCLELVSRLRAIRREDRLYEACRKVTDADEANIVRAAWLLEPTLVAEEVFQGDPHHYKRYIPEWAMRIFEPSFDGLERIVAAMEHVDRHEDFSDRTERFFKDHWTRWVREVGSYPGPADERGHRRMMFIEGHGDRTDARFFRALRHWSDPYRAYRALYAANEQYFWESPREFVEEAETLTADWDVLKRQELLGRLRHTAVQIERCLEEERAEMEADEGSGDY